VGTTGSDASSNAVANTGGGSGGSRSSPSTGGNGGSGIVILRLYS
jgi:hypothetical protein